ncbi:MAG: family 78 glycoside hydrolase catalytic domain [Oscillospiraceae bacterium]|nr:family 78 glycoside hydrolase catalytic domain [Oscillospiraceae bacterium]
MNLTERVWQGSWISDPTYQFDSPASPVPMMFRRCFSLDRRAALEVFATAMGVFDLYLDGQRLHDDYFSPGFTDYSAHLQYVRCEAADLSQGGHELLAVVAGGWAVGRSTHIDDTTKSRSKLTAERQALLCDLLLSFTDGQTQILGTDERWEVTEEGPWVFADFYDGEVYDARIDRNALNWHPAAKEKLCVDPCICARYGEKVSAHEALEPVEWKEAPSGELICDFGQNIAGVVSFRITGKAGQEIVFRHAEAVEHGELYVQNLRSAKQELRYICREGEQEYSPRFTYMGFRYVGIRGIKKDEIEIKAIAVYSDVEMIGSFRCSNEDLNQLQSNLTWSGKDNFVDIPTDCPQRDERQGWTGDIALFSSTACFNFDMSRFLGKWLLDLSTEMAEDGKLPFVIPSRKGITPVMTTSCWSDSCILVPWALYLSNGDQSLLERQYSSMKRYLEDVARYAAMSEGEYGSAHIFKYPFQFGDWCAPYGSVPEWLARGPHVGTPYYYRSCSIMSRIAAILGKEQDAARYAELAEAINRDYLRLFTDGTGKLKEEFQTGYVLPLAFGMGDEAQRRVMAERLWALIRENGVHLTTGFPSTPFLLFALCDAGLQDEAYKLLLQDSRPSWLYAVRHGATTIWERWDSLREDGSIEESSLNHYAYGAVGDFFYRRICGLEAIDPGYRRFEVKPIPGGGLTWAECEHKCPFGLIKTRWEITDGRFKLAVTVPCGTSCEVMLPNSECHTIGSGTYEFECMER